MTSVCLRSLRWLACTSLLLLTVSALPAATKAAAKPAPSPQPALKVRPPAPDPVVIQVGTVKIRASQFDQIIPPTLPPAERENIAKQMGNLISLAATAREQGIQNDPKVKLAMTLRGDQVLAQTLVQKLQQKVQPTDAEVQAYYLAHPKQFAEAQVRHILIADSATPMHPAQRTPAEALALAKKVEGLLKAGGDWNALAKQYSDDPGSKMRGGEIGTVMHSSPFVPHFKAACFSLPVGTISDPVHTRFGYHVIEVEKRDEKPLAQAKFQIAAQLKQKDVEARVNAMEAKHPVIVDGSYFAPPAPAPSLKAPASMAKPMAHMSRGKK